jgi:hypothetical protein
MVYWYILPTCAGVKQGSALQDNLWKKNTLQNGIFTRKSNFSKFHCYKFFMLKMKAKGKPSHEQISNLYMAG